jgi:hypothetical protein
LKESVIHDVRFAVLSLNYPITFGNVAESDIGGNRFGVFALRGVYDQRAKCTECAHGVPFGDQRQRLYERTFFVRMAMRSCQGFVKGGAYSIFTSGVYKATAPDAAFPQEKTHFAETGCAE